MCPLTFAISICCRQCWREVLYLDGALVIHACFVEATQPYLSPFPMEAGQMWGPFFPICLESSLLLLPLHSASLLPAQKVVPTH